MENAFQLITTNDPTETGLIRNMLKDNGIESYAQTDATSEGLEALVGSSPFGSHIYVAADNYQKAKEIVEAYFEDTPQPGVERPGE